ncbi:hypothetical protein NEF87_000266 [Candidatus Lokiarchaeum ossiferum]|uniref:HD/PDEase domain-containing protein n=1 Tax=Candidatus Lokiarchaeum ossiferum TaxID=2951803 RepID=A0ABY6HN45_9ARCH|nr:hypothetical protein NEF87_000266 [Candidatus Lokiarchaeum sp. B-35]
MYSIFHDHSSDKEIENAINFLVKNILSSGNNPKPVILHSIRVGMTILRFNYPKFVIIAGILHDLIEDSSITKSDIAEKFGNEIAELVAINSFNVEIANLEERYQDMFKRCLNHGKSALIVKAADIYDNLSYFIYSAKNYVDGMDNYNYLLKKSKFFANLATNALSDDPIYNLMLNRLKYYEQIK